VNATRALGWLAPAGAGLALVAACVNSIIIPPKTKPAVVAQVSWDVKTDAGIGGVLDQSMSTAFQSAIWQSSFFTKFPDELSPTDSSLLALGARQPLVQVYDSPCTKALNDWDFTQLDGVVHPLVSLGLEPVLQIYQPPWLTPDVAPGSALGLQEFTDYCSGLARYYGPGAAGVPLADGGSVKSPDRVRSWAIWNDPNTNSFKEDGQASLYAQYYSACAARIRAEDPGARIIGPELNDCIDTTNGMFPSGTCLPVNFIPGFLASTADSGPDGGMAPIDVLSMHMFPANFAVAVEGGAVQSDSVALGLVSSFANDISEARSWLVAAGRPDAEVWVTASQVNSDVPTEQGLSNNITTRSPNGSDAAFVPDPRGTSAFFAAWRPYLFSQLGQHGNQSLFQWQYTAGHCPYADAGCSFDDASDTDRQNAEVDYNTGERLISYYVDQALAHKLPPGGSILDVAKPDPGSSGIDVLATRRVVDGRDVVVVMVVDLAVQNEGTDVNGPGAARNVIVDLSKLFAETGTTPASWRASELLIDEAALTRAPAEVGVSILPDQFVPVTFGGYGVAFVTLTRT
jgi:hypothetical protein